jgi:SRSO17 transposase
VKDTDKGPMVWEAKRITLTLKDEGGLPGTSLEWVIARDVLNREKTKFFVSNAGVEAPTDQLLLVGLTRWHVERCFEDGKTELGFDHWEGRSYLGLKRHQIVSALSFLLLAETRHELRGEKPGVDRVPASDRGGGVGAGPRVRREQRQETSRARREVDRADAAGERQSA